MFSIFLLNSRCYGYAVPEVAEAGTFAWKLLRCFAEALVQAPYATAIGKQKLCQMTVWLKSS
jgi:hypothetical protein